MRAVFRRWALSALVLGGSLAPVGESTAQEPGAIIGVALQTPQPLVQDKPAAPAKPDKPKEKAKEDKPPEKPQTPVPPPSTAPSLDRDALARAEARQGARDPFPGPQRSRTPRFLGNAPPPRRFPQGQRPPLNPDFPLPPVPGGPRVGGLPNPWVRGGKIAEHETPAPVDSVYLGFNYFDNLNSAVNLRLGADVNNLRLYRETLAIEKTFLDGRASVGLRLPLNTLDGRSPFDEFDGATTGLGDLTVLLKYALWNDQESGDLLTLGLAVTAPTGRDTLAGSPVTPSIHNASIQPFVGYIHSWGNFFIHGFFSVDVPTDSDDVTMMYNDIGLGYWLYRTPDAARWITGVAPTFEVHVNTPLNHRGALSGVDPLGTPDAVNLTVGVNLTLFDQAIFSVGFVTPVTGPRPMDFEIIGRLEVRF